jgi:CRP-like cAMP-binding protein
MGFFRRLRTAEGENHKCHLKHVGSASFLPALPKDASFLQQFKRKLKKSTLISEFNPQSLEYFRSKAEIFRIKRDHVRSQSWIIHPFSDFRSYYEMWMSVIWFLVIFCMPIEAAFDLFHRHADSILRTKYRTVQHNPFSLILRLICMTDIIITFCTGYTIEKRRKVVMRPLKIVKHYILSIYFIPDVLCSLPLDFFVNSHSTQRILGFLGFLRIIRILTLHTYTSRTLEIFKIRSIASRAIRNCVINLLVFHWFTCFQYMIPQVRFFAYGQVVAESWVERTDLPDLNFISQYIICVYRAAGGLFCIHFEQMQVEIWEERLIAIITFIFGKVYMFFLTVLILNRLLRQRCLEVKYYETISQVQAYMSQKQLPLPMQIRLLQFYDYKYNKKFFQERSIISLLSDKLKGEINLNVCSKLVQNVSMLGHLPQAYLEQVVVNLKPEIYLANDIIIKAGSVGDCMYFLASGTVGVWTPSGKEVCHLQDGAYFGEISLVFKDKRRTANIIALEICEVYKLDRKIFRNTFKASSQLFNMLEEVANERLEITQMFEDVHAKTFMEIQH